MMTGEAAVEGLRRLCAMLSPGATRASLLADWPAPEVWPAIVGQADAHRLLPALATMICRQGLTDRLDDDHVPVLEAVAEWNADRNAGLRGQVLRVSRAFNAAGIRPVWLKGAVSLLPEDGPASGRFMLDLDLWVADPAQRRLARETLAGIGYGFDPAKEQAYAAHKHFPPYLHPGEMAQLELHRSMVGPRYEALLPLAETAARVEWLDWEGTAIGRLDPLSRALCSLAQCIRWGNMRLTREVPLSKAHDFATHIHADFGNALPPDLVGRVQAAGCESEMRPVFTLMESYFGIPNPLPPDTWLLRGVERAARRPRWNAVMAAAGSVLDTRGARLLRHPARIPQALRDQFARLRSARPPFLPGE